MGGDVSKGYSDFVVVDSKEHIIEESFQLDDNFNGHNAMSTYLEGFFKTYPDATLNVGLESTGGYENNWYNLFVHLQSVHSINIARLNPKGVSHHHKARMQRNATDPISAYSIATYLISYKKIVRYNKESNPLDQLCRQWNSLKLLKKQRTQLLNNLNSLIYQSNPELLIYCKRGFPPWALEIINLYPTAKRLKNARAKTLTKKISYLTIEKAEKIIEKAKCSIASHTEATDEFIIQQTVLQIRHLNEAVEAHKEHLEKNCFLPEVKLLTSFTGIGMYSAIGLFLNIIAIARFSSAKKLASFWGIHPKYRKSGDGVWGNYMSKEGRAEARAILFMVAMSAITSNPVIKEIYNKKREEGMCRMAALGVCMHKIVRIIYGMLRTNKEFNPEIDQANQNKKVMKKEKKTSNTNRRFQKIDNDAPISRRQKKKREMNKKDEKPQKINNLENGVNPIHDSIKKNNKYQIEKGKYNIPEKVNEIILRIVNNIENEKSKKN